MDALEHSSESPLQPDPLGVGCAVAPIFLVLLPVLWMIAPLPMRLTSIGKWLYLLSALCLCALIATRKVPDERRLADAARVFFVLVAVLSPFVIGVVGVQKVADYMTVVTEQEELRSPGGNLVIVREYVDQGALGGFDNVYVRGRFVPGLVDWHYSVESTDDASGSRWIATDRLATNEREYRVPWVVAHLSW